MQLFHRFSAAALTAVLVLVAGAGAACGRSDSAGSEPGSETVPLRVGMEAAYPPFESVAANGEIEGLDVDLVRALGAHLGRPVTLRNMAFDALIPELQAGRIDVVASGMSRLEERAKKVDFSRPYARIVMSVLVSRERGAGVTSVSDLDRGGVVIAVQRGTSGELKARAAFPKAEIRPFENQVDASKEVAGARADAFVYDSVSVRKLAEKEPDRLRVLDGDLGGEDYCMAFAKGSPFLAPANAFLDEAAAPGGLLDKLMETWRPEVERAAPDAR